MMSKRAVAALILSLALGAAAFPGGGVRPTSLAEPRRTRDSQ